MLYWCELVTHIHNVKYTEWNIKLCSLNKKSKCVWACENMEHPDYYSSYDESSMEKDFYEYPSSFSNDGLEYN